MMTCCTTEHLSDWHTCFILTATGNRFPAFCCTHALCCFSLWSLHFDYNMFRIHIIYKTWNIQNKSCRITYRNQNIEIYGNFNSVLMTACVYMVSWFLFILMNNLCFAYPLLILYKDFCIPSKECVRIQCNIKQLSDTWPSGIADLSIIEPG